MKLPLFFFLIFVSSLVYAQSEVQRVRFTCTKLKNPKNEIIVLEQVEGDGPTYLDKSKNLIADIGFQMTHYVGKTSNKEEILKSEKVTKYKGSAKRLFDNLLNFEGRTVNSNGDLGPEQRNFYIHRDHGNYATFNSPDMSVFYEFQCENLELVKLKVDAEADLAADSAKSED